MVTIVFGIALFSLAIGVTALWMIGSLGERLKRETADNIDHHKIQTDLTFRETGDRINQSDTRIDQLSAQIGLVESKLRDLASQPGVSGEKISSLEDDVADLRRHLQSLEQGLPQNLRARRPSQSSRTTTRIQ
jgi:peptidoglycan hydrolase CwlO-like protein